MGRMWWLFGLACFCASSTSACAPPAPSPAPLASVSSLPAPVLPNWIGSISPTSRAASRAQIRVIFTKPVLPLQQLETDTEKAVLAQFEISPQLPGRFRVLTPRMIGFEADRALPAATRVRITLKAGLHDLAGDRLTRDLAWTFETQPLKITALPTQTDGRASTPVTGLNPVIQVSANTMLDRASLERHAEFVTPADRVDARATLAPQQSGAPWTYNVTPAHALPQAAPYRLTIEPGVAPAEGNLPSAARFERAFTTFAPLQIERTTAMTNPNSAGESHFAGGDPAIVFNNALDPKTIDANVTVTPSRGSGKAASLSDDGTTLYVNPYRLQPQQTYRVSFGSGLRDVFGQTLSSPAQTVRTANLAPYLWAPSGTNTFMTTGGLRLVYHVVNLPRNTYASAYRPVEPADLVYGDMAYSILPPVSGWTQSHPSPARDRETSIEVPVRERLGATNGVLAYGVTAAIPQQRFVLPYFGLVALTDLGVDAQWFTQSGAISVQRLRDGAPISGARVDVYVSHLGEKPGGAMPCASGTTDAAGSLEVTGIAIERCYIGNRPADEAPSLLVIARKGDDWTYLRSEPYSGLETYDGDATWTGGEPISRGTIYSDRMMYQPGERAWLSAVCYVLQNGVLHADRAARYTLQLFAPDGSKRVLPPQTTNAYATFSFPLDLSKSQALGYYTIVATSPDGAKITGSFRVAEFKPPNFSVTLALDRAYAPADTTVRATGSARYLFGAPMRDARAVAHVTREPIAFHPSGWDEFSFGRQWFWPQDPPSLSADVLTAPLTLDANGRASTTVRVDSDLPMPMAYHVDLEVSDVSNLSTSDTQTFTALPSATLIGLHNDFVGTMGRPVKSDIIVTDPNGKAQAGVHVHLVLQRMRYSSVTQIVEGSESGRDQVQYDTVAHADVVSATRPVSSALTPQLPGPYRIRATIAGAASDASASDSEVWISGPGEAAWGGQNPSALSLQLDKKSYGIGETANLAVASPYARADLYVEVVRDRILWKRRIHIDGNAPRVSIPIRPGFFPNAAVHAVLVRRGAPLNPANARGVDSLVRIGMLPLALDLHPQYLALRVQAQQPRTEPGSRQGIDVRLRDRYGRPVRGQVTLIVANDAVLRLSGYRPPDLVQTVFAEQPISMRFADSRPDVTLAQPGPPSEKGWGYGGGFLAGAAGTRVRTQFSPLAYFAGSVLTDASGNAHVAFRLPDDLTTWRILAVAADAAVKPHFATADATFITTKPLVTNALLPQFARTGDRFDGGVSVLDNGSAAASVRTQGRLTGALTFASARGSQTLDASPQVQPGINGLRFPMIVGAGTAATMQFLTSLGEHSDAFSVPLVIRNADVTESRIDAGASNGIVSIPFDARAHGGTIRIVVASSLRPQIAAAADRAMNGEPDDFLSSHAARLGVAASLALLGRPATGAAAQVSAIAALQRLDGGFGFWPQADSSDAFASAYAVSSLAYAKRAGLAVDSSTIARAKPYLVRALADPHGVDRSCDDLQCKMRLRLTMLQALADLGDRRTDFVQALYAGRAAYGIGEKTALARYLQSTPGWHSQAQTLASEIERSAYLTGRYAAVSDADGWPYSPVSAQASYLQLLVANRATPGRMDAAARALLDQACKCGWPSPQESDAALRALTALALHEPQRSGFNVTALAGSTILGTIRTSDDAAHPATLTLAAARIRGASHVILRKDRPGTLHYILDYSYHLPADAPGRIAGLRVEREIRRANDASVLDTIGLAAPAPLTFASGQVLDVAISIITDHPVDKVLLSDPLPAGFEAVDTSFSTTPAFYAPLAGSWQIDYQRIYHDRVEAFAQHLDAGVYEFDYLVRVVTPGTYRWPGTQAKLLDAPEEFGRAAAAQTFVTASS
ncbi:MAG: Ig-like domain-containing protein [Candidatus Eremiobacteraeota bacterium]|nr:Ig-like domain-containing protein [Candidatus Eremiobacteraeota bacterium]